MSGTSHARGGDTAIIAIFLAVIGTPLVAMAVAQVGFGLAPVSEVRDASVLPRPIVTYGRFRAYFEDHFIGRPALVQAHADFRRNVLGASPSVRVAYGRDRMLFYTDEIELACSRHSQFTEAQLAEWASALQARHDLVERRGGRYLFVVAPDKHTIYEDKVPDIMRPVRPASRLDQLLEYLQARTTVNVVDLRPALRLARTSGPVYFRTDTHWNSTGALVASQVIASRLSQWFPSIRPPERAEYEVSRRTYDGDLGTFIGTPDELGEEYEQLEPIVRRARFFMPNGQEVPDAVRLHIPAILSSLPAASPGKLVVFRDSFGRALLPHLAGYFQNGTYLWSRFDAAMVENLRPTVVIDQIVERALMLITP